jgi:hypothetical protein
LPVVSSSLVIPAVFAKGGGFLPKRNLYPLSRDHLLPLIEYNLFRATLTNLFILGHLHLASNCRFGEDIPIFPSTYGNDNLPQSLVPTALQRCTPHADWIDLLPSPRMRDNAIRTQHLFSNLDLVADIMGDYLCHGMRSRQGDGGVESEVKLLVWSNPWEPGGWELTEGFVRKWRFLVDGCDDLFQATNQWRKIRGDGPLRLDIE